MICGYLYTRKVAEQLNIQNDSKSNSSDESPLIVIVSNRGPFSFKVQESGDFITTRGAGGLVTALSALAEQHDVLWVAAALGQDDIEWAKENPDVTNVQGINLKLIITDDTAYDQFYNQISNPLLWFIQHQLWDAPRNPRIDEDTWNAWRNGYTVINRQFANAIADAVETVDRPVIVFPQDYHLYMVPKYLRERVGDKVQIQPFIHIPWPSPDAWRMLPKEMREGILSSLLSADRVGFQTESDAFNFIQTCRFYLKNAHTYGSRVSINYQGRKTESRTYPISVDVEKVRTLTNDPQTNIWKNQIAGLVGGSRLILRTDRVEPSKNILRGLEAYRILLENHPEHIRKVQMVALLVPSRMGVDEYQSYLREIMAEAGFINADYGDGVWEPVRVILGDNYYRALAAMELYDVLLVNPITDGMNLVAKEGALINARNGVLVLSEHAGAFYELGDHTLAVSPFDVYSTAEALHQALQMPEDERRVKSQALKEMIEKADVRQWFYNQVQDALAALTTEKNE